MYYETSDILRHHGILGMKWGVRRYRNYDGTLTNEGKSRYAQSNNHTFKKVAKGIYDKLDTFDYGCIIDGKRYNETNLDEVDWSKYRTSPVDSFEKNRIGVCWDYTNYQHAKLKAAGVPHNTHMLVMDTDDGPVTHTFTTFKDSDGSKYWLEQSLYSERGIHPIKSYKDAVSVIAKRYDPSGKRDFDVYQFNPDGMDKGLSDKEFFNLATAGDPVMQRKQSKYELYHHGILGMKWGVRRYRNKDGTLTEAGKRHYQKADQRWAVKNNAKVMRRTSKKVAKDLNKFNKALSKQPGYYNSRGQVSRTAMNAYNAKMAELMNTKVGDIRSPSGKVVRFVAKRGDVGVYMALATPGYDMSKTKGGVWSGGRVAYKTNKLDTIDI